MAHACYAMSHTKHFFELKKKREWQPVPTQKRECPHGIIQAKKLHQISMIR
jgi:hypothetical protein